MTSITSHSKRAFSLVELLVVIGIIVVLASFALPMLIKAYSSADKSKQKFDLQAISVCLEAYRSDFQDYPRPDPATDPATDRGARVLCRALVGPGGVEIDGADGMGFRVRKSPGPDGTLDTTDDVGMGAPSGPYLSMDRFKIAGTGAAATLTSKDDKVILYYPARSKKVDVTLLDNYVNNGTNSMINSDDNSAHISENTLRVLLGDYGYNGRIDAQFSGCVETQRFHEPFLLVLPGADGTYGATGLNTSPSPSIAKWNTNKQAMQGCDDITNIPQ